MSFDWIEYLNLAQELAGPTKSTSTQEARSRSAISRAYYAVFCKARNYLRDRDQHLIPSGGEVHWYVINQLKRSPIKEYKKVGYALDRLRIDRNIADYDDTFMNLLDTVEADLKLATQAIARLSRL